MPDPTEVHAMPDPSVSRATPHAGHRWAWVEEDTHGYMAWRVVPAGDDRPCRWMEGGSSCKAPSVARLLRSHGSGPGRWWHYCAEHLFGRIVHDGRVWSARLVPVEGTAGGENDG